jgi:sigma-B regulation protein RsbU (phosphoserine phosphatase)
MSDPVLTAIVQAAAEFTAATAGWLVTAEGERLRVMAVAGEAPAELVGTLVEGGTGAAAYVLASGQPLALASRGSDPRQGAGLAQALGRQPGSVLSVPCEADDAVAGAVELIDKAGGAGFSFDDVELATVLARIAGVSLTATARGQGSTSLSLADLPRELARLAAEEPDQYPAVAAVVSALMGGG